MLNCPTGVAHLRVCPGGRAHGEEGSGSAVRETDVSRPGGACGQAGARESRAREFRAARSGVRQLSVGRPDVRGPGPALRAGEPAAAAEPGWQPPDAGAGAAPAGSGACSSAVAGARRLDSAAGPASSDRACPSRVGLRAGDGIRGSAARTRGRASGQAGDSAAGTGSRARRRTRGSRAAVRSRAHYRPWFATGINGRAGYRP